MQKTQVIKRSGLARIVVWALTVLMALTAFFPAMPGRTAPIGAPIEAHAASGGIKAFDRFFVLKGYTDPYGSGHTWRFFYVPGGSGQPQPAMCYGPGLRGAPDESMGPYVIAGEQGFGYDWEAALYTFGGEALQKYGVDYHNWMDPQLFWAVQNVIWWHVNGGSWEGSAGASAASNGGDNILADLLAASQKSPVVASDPHFFYKGEEFTDAHLVFTAEEIDQSSGYYNHDNYVRYGPIWAEGMADAYPANVEIYMEDDSPMVDGVFAGNIAGEPVGVDHGEGIYKIKYNGLKNNEQFYIYVPRAQYLTTRIEIQMNAKKVEPNLPGRAWRAWYGRYQPFCVPGQFDPHTKEVYGYGLPGGFTGEGVFVKADDGWISDYGEVNYEKIGKNANSKDKGDQYRLEQGQFAIQQWSIEKEGWEDTSVAVAWDAALRVWRFGFCAETKDNDGRFRIHEIVSPYAYRGMGDVEFSVKALYDKMPDRILEVKNGGTGYTT